MKEFKSNEHLVSILKDIVKGSSTATIEATTMPKMTVKHRETKIPYADCFKGSVCRTAKRFVNVGLDYTKCVNKQLDREGKVTDFVSDSLPFGEWVDGLKDIAIIKDDGTLYLRYYQDMNANSKHTEYVYHYSDGTLLNENEISLLSGFLPKPRKATNQGTSKEIKPRSIKMNGIVSIKAWGEELIRQ